MKFWASMQITLFVVWISEYRSSRSKIYFRISVLKNFTMFTGKHLCWSLFFNTSAGLKACNFIKNRLQHKFFFMWNLQNFLELLSLQNTSGGCRWKYLLNSLFIAFENNEWCHFVVCMGPPALISFYCVCFVSFYFFLFFLFCSWILLLFDSVVNFSILKTKQWSCF